MGCTLSGVAHGKGTTPRGSKPFKQYIGHKLEFCIMQASVNLDNFTNVRDVALTLKRSLEQGKIDGTHNIREPLFKEMLIRIGAVDRSYVIDKVSGNRLFKTENLVKCCESALTALGVLDRVEDGVQWYAREAERMKDLFLTYIQKQPPMAWEKLFGSAFNLAIFLKYASFEDMDLAYDQITSINTVNSILPDKLRSLLEHTKRIYTEPIISKEQIKVIMDDTSPQVSFCSFYFYFSYFSFLFEQANAYNDILDLLDTKGRSQYYEEGRLIHRLSIAWIKHFNRGASVKFPVPPRNVQIINMLNISEWIYQTTSQFSGGNLALNILNFARIWSAGNCRCLITQVGTGEGKSVTIAFIVVYCVLVLGKKVHVLENNEGLLEKDYAQFEDFYRSHFNINVQKADNSTPGAPSDQDPLLKDAQVIYLTSRGISHSFSFLNLYLILSFFFSFSSLSQPCRLCTHMVSVTIHVIMLFSLLMK